MSGNLKVGKEVAAGPQNILVGQAEAKDLRLVFDRHRASIASPAQSLFNCSKVNVPLSERGKGKLRKAPGAVFEVHVDDLICEFVHDTRRVFTLHDQMARIEINLERHLRQVLTQLGGILKATETAPPAGRQEP